MNLKKEEKRINVLIMVRNVALIFLFNILMSYPYKKSVKAISGIISDSSTSYTLIDWFMEIMPIILILILIISAITYVKRNRYINVFINFIKSSLFAILINIILVVYGSLTSFAVLS